MLVGSPLHAPDGKEPIMKRLLPLLLSLTLLLPALCGCGEKWEGYEKADLDAYITLGNYVGVEYSLVSTEVTDKQVDEAIEKVRSDNMIKSEVTSRPSAKNDYVVIDYTTSVDAGVISALSDKDKTFAVASTYTLKEIPGFSESLLDRRAGDTYVFELTFPADYKNDSISDITLVAGKKAKVEVVIDSLFEYVKPELNDEFVGKVSKTAKTVAEYKAEVRAQLKAEAEELAKTTMQEDVWAAVLEGCEVKKYPSAELDKYKTEMQEYYEEYASYYGYEFEEFLSTAYGYTPEQFEKKKTEYAESSVLSDLALYAVAAKEGLSVNEEEYKAGLKRYFEMTGAELGLKTEQAFEEYYTKEMIMQSVLWDEVIDLLCQSAVGVEKSEETTAQP